MSDKHTLYLDFPGKNFEEGSPVGNGSLGAMLMGDPKTEKIYLSEESIWSGNPIKTEDPDFRNKIQKLRQLHLEGKDYLLDDTANEIMKGSVHRIKSNEYAGLLSINLGKSRDAKNYKRLLHLDSGVFEASWTKDGVDVKETAFADYSYEVLCIRYSFSQKTGFSFSYKRENTAPPVFDNNLMTVTGVTREGNHHFAVGIKVITDGNITFSGGSVSVKNAGEAVLFIAVTTEFNFGDEYCVTLKDILDEAENYDEIYDNHCEDFSAIFCRSEISFACDEKLSSIPFNKRLQMLKDNSGHKDYGLYSLYFDFGKYLMLSSSREGTLPANLQGVWTEKLENPWNADYHTNINLQMNYWFCNTANIGECNLQLFDYMNNYLLESGKKTAKTNYGCRGTVEHHLSDIYGYTAPADGLWGIWPMGAAWLSTHMWEHYRFTLDKDFLKETAYQYIKECALFFIDYLFEDKSGYLASGPSMSPENEYFIEKDGKKQAMYLCFSPTMDIEIISEVFRNYIEAENILHLDEKTKLEAEEKLSKLPPLKIGKRGNLMEWQEDYEEPEPGHRHISHAYGLYPGNTINENTPDLLKAIEKTFEIRLSNGGGHTGWSRAWLINLFARLKNGEKTFENLRNLMTHSTLDSMLDTHPPFQIDGNFGGAAGIAEALLQSQNGYIDLLPAVTDDLSGSFKGLCSRGAIQADAQFKDGIILSVKLTSEICDETEIRIHNAEYLFDGENKIRINKNGRFTVKTNKEYIATI